MSQNPYSQFGGPGTQQYGGDFVDPMPTRTSVLAIIGLVVSIVGCIACVVPGPGAFAAILGGLAVFFMARSSGRLTGMGLAITAIVLGLFQSVACIAVITGLSQANTQVGKEFFVPMGQTMAAIENGDMKGARAMLTPKASAAVTDEMLRDFVKQYHATAGNYQKMPENLLETVIMGVELGKASKHQRGGGNYSQRPGEMTFPLPAKFAQGSALVMISMDPTLMGQHDQGSKSQQTLMNLGVVTLDGKEVWLIDPDVARKLTSKPFGYTPAKPSKGSGSGDGSPADPDAEKPDAPPDAPKPGT